MTKLSMVLPVHNQEEIIGKTFKEIYQKVTKVSSSVEFILVENGSTDKTRDSVKKIAQRYKNTKWTISPKGYGSAVLQGLKISKGEYFCYMPSDGQVDLKVFPEIWELAQSGKWKIVKIKRQNRESIIRSIVSISFALVMSTLFKAQLVDVNGSPRILRTNTMRSLKLKYTDSFIDAEMLIKITKLNWKIKEIPMKYFERAGGKSSRSYKTFLEFFKNIILYFLNKIIS